MCIYKTKFKKEIGLYIHIPFCKSKCNYCDFNSSPCYNHLIPEYFRALNSEVSKFSCLKDEFKIKSVFIGGGTPALVEERYIFELLSTINKTFSVDKGAEITIEANPGTLNINKLKSYRESGINRLSIGLQAWQNEMLKFLGRSHLIDEFIESYENALKAGFDNINVDLIFGIPGQTIEQWEETLENVISLKPAHVSCYSLKIEEGTEFGRRYGCGKLEPMDDSIDREMYYLAQKKLEAAGLLQYEISNFARAGFKSRHNLVYWRAEEYLGLGAGSHSYLKGRRYNNLYDPESYIKKSLLHEEIRENIQVIDKNESIREYMILGLRLTEGINIEGFKKRFDEDIMELFPKVISKHIEKGLLSFGEGNIKLTPRGMDFANVVMEDFC